MRHLPVLQPSDSIKLPMCGSTIRRKSTTGMLIRPGIDRTLTYWNRWLTYRECLWVQSRSYIRLRGIDSHSLSALCLCSRWCNRSGRRKLKQLLFYPKVKEKFSVFLSRIFYQSQSFKYFNTIADVPKFATSSLKNKMKKLDNDK